MARKQETIMKNKKILIKFKNSRKQVRRDKGRQKKKMRRTSIHPVHQNLLTKHPGA
jgi:hypothetical protein